jgi:hypothetical protein
MKRTLASLAIVFVFSLAHQALAQRPAAPQGPRAAIAGQVTAWDGKTLTLKTKTGGETVKIGILDNANVSVLTKATLADIKQNDYIASAGKKNADGTLSAYDIRILPESFRGRIDTFSPYPAGGTSTEMTNTMTNATIDAVVTHGGDGKTLKVKYKGGEQTIVVTPQTAVMRQDVGKRDDVKVGANVSVAAVKTDKGFVGTRVAVGKDGAIPPI